MSENNDESDGEEVFFVDGTGRIAAAGGLETGPAGSLVAKGGLVSQRSTILERKRAIRDEAGGGNASAKSGRGGAGAVSGGSDEEEEGGGVEVDASIGTFFEVPDDGREGSANVLRIKVGSDFFSFGWFSTSVPLVQSITSGCRF